MADSTFDLISTADIARLAGQRPATVRNWKSRYPDFPQERGRGPRGPLYDSGEVTAWLVATDRLDKRPQEVEAIWTLMDQFRGQEEIGEAAQVLLVLLAVMSRSTPEEWQRIRLADPGERDAAIRSAIHSHFLFEQEWLPDAEMSTPFVAAAVSMMSNYDRDRRSAMAEVLLERFTKTIGHRGGDFLTPEPVRRLVVGLADPVGVVYNPATGIGQLMVDAADAHNNSKEVTDSGRHHLTGQESDYRIWAMAQLNLAIHGVYADIAIGDVFADDRQSLIRADRVIAVPPWNQKISIDHLSKSDPRWVFGEPGPNDGNAAWIQHCLYHLADEGRAVLVLPTSALFEAGRAGRIRQRVIKAGLLDAVIALPAGLFASTSIATAVLVFSRRSIDRNAQPESLMIDLSELSQSQSRQTTSVDDDVLDKVVRTYRRWTEGEPPDMHGAAIAGFDEIAANDFVIVPARYQAVVDTARNVEQTMERKRSLLQRVGTLSAASRNADNQLDEALAHTETSSFTEVRLGDLSSKVTIARGFPTHRAVLGGAVPVMSIADLRNGSPARHFADLDAIWDTGLTEAVPGDVLLAIEGGTVGETLVVGEGTGPFVPSQQVAILRVADTASIDPWYLGAWFSTEQARAQLLRLASGVAIQRVRIRDLQSLTVKLPPLLRQQEIGRHFVAFESAIEGHRAVAECLEDLRNVQLDLAFSDANDDAAQTPDVKGEERHR